jgi:hypothetical protein
MFTASRREGVPIEADVEAFLRDRFEGGYLPEE